MSIPTEPRLDDPDNPEVSRDAFDRGVPIPDGADTATVTAALDTARRRYRGQRGPQKAPRKQMVSLRLDAAVLARFRATGKGWQGRINDTLAAHLPQATRRRKAS